MENIKKFATQLSKITDCITYDYSFEVASNHKSIATTEKDLGNFFIDAKKYVELIIGDSEYLDKIFVLTFENEELMISAKMILKAMQYEITDLSDEYDSKYSFGVLVFDESANEFIFSSRIKESPLYALARTLECNIKFSYDYNHFDKFVNQGTVSKGKTRFEIEISPVEIVEVSEMFKFNTEIIKLIDICPDYTAFNSESVVIRFISD